MEQYKTRCYIFSHAILGSIHKGVQSAHCVAEICKNKDSLTKQWQNKDKTLILLNGGFTSELEETKKEIETLFKESDIPFASFNEDHKTAAGMLTATGFILPIREYNMKPNIDWLYQNFNMNSRDSIFENLMEKLVNSKLAS